MVVPLHKPDFREKLFFFTSGIIMSIPLTILAEQLSNSLASGLPELFSALLLVAIIAPFVEEFAKAYPLFYRHGETERSIVTLGFLAGLGFGVIEFFLYIFVYSAPLMIRLPELFFHASNTSITAYGIANKKPLPFYLTAVGLHFIINFSAIFDQLWLIGFIFSLWVSYFLSWSLYKKTTEKVVV
ncbi:MAG: protease PrsW [Thermoproteota archaeon]|nr:protease PrsW [Thermoproteota archaeon]